MALTDNSDIYVAVHDAGVNRILHAVFTQRPSLVNLGTAGFVHNPERLCEKVEAHPVVSLRGNPLVGLLPPLPVLLTPYSVEYCFQVTALELDIHPGDIVSLPPELHPPLGAQRLALHAGACVGYGCPPADLVDKLPYLPPITDRELVDRSGRDQPFGHGPVDRLTHLPPRPVRGGTIPAGELLCTCLDIGGMLGFDFTGPAGHQHLVGRLDGLEIVDLGPTTLEDSIECYLSLVVKLGLLPQLAVPVIAFSKATGLLSLAVEPTPSTAALPFNPALEDDQLKLYLDLAVGPGQPQPPGGGSGGGGGSSPPPDPGVVRARTRTGTFDATAAFAERAVRELFAGVRDGFSESGSGSRSFGPFSLSYAAEVHLENGTVDLRPDGTIALEELDVAFDTLELCLGIDLPEICIGGFCIIGIPFDGCLVRAPRFCLFEDDPDLEVCLDIGPFLRLELSATLEAVSKYAVNLARTAGMNDWDAVQAGIPNHWQVYVDPVSIDIDLFDVADIVGDLLEDALDAVLDTILGPLPGWAKDLIRAILGPVIDVVRALLDLGDDIEEWLSEKLGVSLGLFDFILTVVADHLAKGRPLAEIPDPLTILPTDGALIPVLVPIEFLGLRVDADEMVVEVDLGG